MANNTKDNEIIDEAARKLQEEKEALLKEIKGDYGKLDETDEVEDADKNEENTSDNPAPEIEEDQKKLDSKEEIEDVESEDDISQEPVKVGTPMPKYGKAFLFVPISIVLTIAAIVLGHIPPITSGIPANQIYRYVYIGFGALFLAIALMLIVNAVSDSDILTNAQMGKLVTTGIYRKTRNPMYAGVLFACTGALFISGNAFMYALPIIYYILLTFMVKNIEEPLLLNRFGEDYEEYMENTYRVFPIPKSS